MADNRVVFHFNKAHNQDPSIPPWVVKAKGNTHYVDHFTCNTGFTTKETPDNPHTKGSIQCKGELVMYTNKDGQLIAEVR